MKPSTQEGAEILERRRVKPGGRQIVRIALHECEGAEQPEIVQESAVVSGGGGGSGSQRGAEQP